MYALYVRKEPACDYNNLGCNIGLFPLEAKTYDRALKEASEILFGLYGKEDGETEFGLDHRERDIGELGQAILFCIMPAYTKSVLEDLRAKYLEDKEERNKVREQSNKAKRIESERKEYERLKAKYEVDGS